MSDLVTNGLVNLVTSLVPLVGVAVLLIEHVMRAVMALSRRVIVINYGERIAEGRAWIATGAARASPRGRWRPGSSSTRSSD